MARIAGSSLERSDRRYIASVMQAPLLDRDHEADLGRRWRDRKDEIALHELINSHVRLVVRIAAGFRGYGLPLGDLIQEGNVGLLEAATRFDPERNVRFSTYATWWILAAIQDYIVRNASIVRIGTTPSQKSLFFNLRRLRARLGEVSGAMSDEHRRLVAKELNVPLAAVDRMEAHLAAPDRSLNAGIGGAETDELQDFIADDGPSPEEIVTDRHDAALRSHWLREAMATLTPRERDIIRHRFLDDDGKTTLAEIGETYGVTKERIRQIEGRALAKLKAALDAQHGQHDRGELLPAD